MSDSPPHSPVLLTVGDVRSLREERDAVARQHHEIGRKLALLNSKLEAAALFLPSHLVERLMEESSVEENPRRKWAPTLFRLLEDAGHGLTTADIRGKLKGTPLESEVGYQGGALYNALSKLVAKKQIVKIDSHYCLPGQEPPKERSLASSGAAQAIEADILDALSKNPDGLKSMGIAQHILQTGAPSAAGMRKSTGYLYKVLSILVASGTVIKEGRLYYLAAKKNEPSDVPASDGSDAGSGGERRRALRLI